jgi:hypothetical protein
MGFYEWQLQPEPLPLTAFDTGLGGRAIKIVERLVGGALHAQPKVRVHVVATTSCRPSPPKRARMSFEVAES